ncbi:hypothetical protein MMC14_000751 [Varicellaria rhodocarpa]|nr:hypothetical protein [Varicellaria rhodocarpa]
MSDLAQDEEQAHAKATTFQNLVDRLRSTIKRLESQNATLQERLTTANEETKSQKALQAQEAIRLKEAINPPPSFPFDDDKWR